MKVLILTLAVLAASPALAQRDADGRPCDTNIYYGGCKSEEERKAVTKKRQGDFGLCAIGNLAARRFTLCPSACLGEKVCTQRGEVFTVLRTK
jgi:hypothetical protein